jgi:hypothetical protein
VLRTPGGGIQPQLAVDTRGGIHLLYFKGEAAHGDLFYSRLENTGQFSQAIQVNAHPGSAIAIGTIRGGQLALGRDGRVHVAWYGSDKALPRTPAGTTPVLYTRINAERTAFEPERNLVGEAAGLDGAGVAADAAGNVYVLWHAGAPGTTDEGARRVWVARSTDDGQTFAKAAPASDASTGACGCCGVRALTDRNGALYVLYRSAREAVHRDSYLLISRDKGLTFTKDRVQEWNVNACPMSTFSLSATSGGVLAAWQTGGQVQWLRVDHVTGSRSAIVPAPGPERRRKHPAIAGNAAGETLLAWTEGTGWNEGGAVAWQRFGKDGAATAQQGRMPALPAWGLAAVATRPDGSFVITY